MKLAERLRADLEGATIKFPNGGELSVTASFGVAVKGELERPEQLVALADEALYDAKRNGKNRVVVADAQAEAHAAASA
jgi:diguanylate cyclase